MQSVVNESYDIAERRTHNTKGGYTTVKRVKLSPSEEEEVEWVDEANLNDVQYAANFVCELIDDIRTRAQKIREDNIPETVRDLTSDLEPLTFVVTESSAELDAVRHDRHPSLILLWLRALDRVSCFVQVMYSFANIVKLRDAHRARVPQTYKHDMGPVFVRNMQCTQKLLSSKEFYLAWANVLKTLDLADRIASPRLFLKRILLDIEALEHDLPPPSYTNPGFYHQKLEAIFPPVVRSKQLSHTLFQQGEIPGMFPEEQSSQPQSTQAPITRSRGRIGNRANIQPQPGRGALPRPRQSPGAAELRDSVFQIARGKINKTAVFRAKAHSEISWMHRLSRVYQNSNLFKAIRGQANAEFTPKEPPNHRSALAQAPTRRKRTDQATPPRLRSRTTRAVHFAEGTLSPRPRNRNGLDIPHIDDPAPSSPSPSSPRAESDFVDCTPGAAKNENTAGDKAEASPSQSMPNQGISDLNWGLKDLDIADTISGPRGPKLRYIPLDQRPSSEETREAIQRLLSEPSPPGLRQSDESKLAIELRKKKEAAEAAEAKRRAEEEARRETEEKARRKLEERLAKSGGLRLPNKPFVEALSKSWVDKAHNTLRAAGSTSLATTSEGVDLRRHDFAKVVPETEWLNDEIVNGSLTWLDKAINTAAGIKNVKTQTRKCLTLNSFFFKRLKDQGVTGTVRTLSRNGVKKENLLDIDTILLPICENLHWTLLVVRPKKRTVSHMDSLNPRGNQANTTLALNWMKEVLQEKFVADEWKVVRHEAPRQTNGWDCGVHTITNAMCVSLGLNPIDTYTAEDMPVQRLRIASVLLNGGFTGDFDLQQF